ncbi:MAG: PhoU domain-containing protein [Planctomycetota bacterium]|jgi:phosphate uptake regulator
MWKELWSLLSQGDSLLDEARREAIGMLELAQEMFEVVLEAMVEEIDEKTLDRIARMDQVLNDKQQSIRKKVFEHLAVSKGSDLLMGLVLTSVVIDLERIGDYTKNVGEAVSFFPGRLDCFPHGSKCDDVIDRTRRLFVLTSKAFERADPDKARESAEFYHHISRDVDAVLKELLGAGPPEEKIERRALGLALLLRYLKRMGAHLKNICTAVSNPFPSIGYRPNSV